MNLANPPTQTSTVRQSVFSGREEPRLVDLYCDPILHAVLRRDGVELATLKSVVSNAQKRLAS